MQRTVVDLKFIMSTLLPFLPSGEFQEDEESSFLGGAVNVGVWTLFNGVPLDTRIKDCMEAIPSMLEASNVAVNNPRLVVRAELTNGPSLDMARLHKALQVRILLVAVSSVAKEEHFFLRMNFNRISQPDWKFLECRCSPTIWTSLM
jgi:hypothetical protein